jgi:bilirubin oxidase
MKKRILLIYLFVFSVFQGSTQTYNPLWIPDTLTGPVINLSLEEGTKNWIGTYPTASAGVNPSTVTNTFWGPTLILEKGDSIHINVTNNLMDTTTIHWHGMHLPALMDGGPHQPIAPGQTWSPYWKIDNYAATYWYHPHLHMMAEEQLLKGLGGMIILRDSTEKTLALPRTYGVDDIPLALSDRAFINNEISIEPYGDSMMVNGVMRAEFNAPAQVMRFRILNGGTERSYNIGFSDTTTFYVIASDGGLLSAPVPLTRYLLSSGERIEILVNFTGRQGQSLFMKAYNSVLTQNIPGGDMFPNGPFANYLQRSDFNIMHIVIGSQTANPITVIPSNLVSVNPYDSTNSVLTRYLTISDTNIAGNPGISFLINHHLYSDSFIDYQIPLDNTEIWQIANSGNFSHPFHLHDVEFNLISRNGAIPPAAEQGWKDVVLVKAHETVRFVTKFSDFADAAHPYMFHCHIALHEDEGMMGQFVVVNNSSGIHDIISNDLFEIYPNPSFEKIYISLKGNTTLERLEIYNCLGENILNLENPIVNNPISISSFKEGVYFLTIRDESGRFWKSRFIKS